MRQPGLQPAVPSLTTCMAIVPAHDAITIPPKHEMEVLGATSPDVLQGTWISEASSTFIVLYCYPSMWNCATESLKLKL